MRNSSWAAAKTGPHSSGPRATWVASRSPPVDVRDLSLSRGCAQPRRQSSAVANIPSRCVNNPFGMVVSSLHLVMNPLCDLAILGESQPAFGNTVDDPDG